MDQIRGVDSSYTMGLLQERKLIEECGRLQVPGRPRLYRTTKEFLRVFHLSSLEELPEMPGLEADGQLRLDTDGAILDFRPILEGTSPARELAGAPKGRTRSKIVDLDNSAVHIKIKGAAGFANALDLGNGILNVGIYVIARGYREAEGLDIIQRFAVGGKCFSIHRLQV